MIKAFIFDCFGVLYIDASKAFYEQRLPQYHQLHDEIKDIDRQQDYGLISQQEHDQAIAELTGLPRAVVASHEAGGHRRNDQLLAFSQSLRPEFRLGMLSNIGPGAIDRYFSTGERQELFDAVVLSGDVGLTKPHPAVFELMAERLRVTPGECVMIDNLEENCAGADAAGMKAILYRTNRQVTDDIQRLLAANKSLH